MKKQRIAKPQKVGREKRKRIRKGQKGQKGQKGSPSQEYLDVLYLRQSETFKIRGRTVAKA